MPVINQQQTSPVSLNCMFSELRGVVSKQKTHEAYLSSIICSLFQLFPNTNAQRVKAGISQCIHMVKLFSTPAAECDRH